MQKLPKPGPAPTSTQLRALMRGFDLTIQDVAEALGVSQQGVKFWLAHGVRAYGSQMPANLFELLTKKCAESMRNTLQ